MAGLLAFDDVVAAVRAHAPLAHLGERTIRECSYGWERSGGRWTRTGLDHVIGHCCEHVDRIDRALCFDAITSATEPEYFKTLGSIFRGLACVLIRGEPVLCRRCRKRVSTLQDRKDLDFDAAVAWAATNLIRRLSHADQGIARVAPERPQGIARGENLCSAGQSARGDGSEHHRESQGRSVRAADGGRRLRHGCGAAPARGGRRLARTTASPEQGQAA